MKPPHVIHAAGELGTTRVTALIAWEDAGGTTRRELIEIGAYTVNVARTTGGRSLFLHALKTELCRVGAHWPGCGCVRITAR